ncbi:hypothetical protein CALCODRAFT_492417 [Calocera cornea HHB12733]|uniref:Uncharacterized protein n=1 Tax=Calocera cornea HHB12733 TaxID=1353952 RepID=A0A165IC08_9BASI|nr:hypothetical protein CALCODRAFT_492417 [Calocera cornea HHB12733]
MGATAEALVSAISAIKTQGWPCLGRSCQTSRSMPGTIGEIGQASYSTLNIGDQFLSRSLCCLAQDACWREGL